MLTKRWGIVPVTLNGDKGEPFPQRYSQRRATAIAAAMTGQPRFGKPRFVAVRLR